MLRRVSLYVVPTPELESKSLLQFQMQQNDKKRFKGYVPPKCASQEICDISVKKNRVRHHCSLNIPQESFVYVLLLSCISMISSFFLSIPFLETK